VEGQPILFQNRRNRCFYIDLLIDKLYSLNVSCRRNELSVLDTLSDYTTGQVWVKFHPKLHTRRSPTQIDIYQMSY